MLTYALGHNLLPKVNFWLYPKKIQNTKSAEGPTLFKVRWHSRMSPCQKIQAWIVVWDITYFTFKSDKNLWPANLLGKQSDYSTYFKNFSKWILTCFGPINWTSISSSVILEYGINVIFPSSPVTLTPASVFIFFAFLLK